MHAHDVMFDFASGRDAARADQARNAQDPTLHLCYCTLRRCEVGLEERGEATVLIGAGEPGGKPHTTV